MNQNSGYGSSAGTRGSTPTGKQKQPLSEGYANMVTNLLNDDSETIYRHAYNQPKSSFFSSGKPYPGDSFIDNKLGYGFDKRTVIRQINALKATASRVGEMSEEEQEALLPLIGQAYEYLQMGDLGTFNNFMSGKSHGIIPSGIYPSDNWDSGRNNEIARFEKLVKDARYRANKSKDIDDEERFKIAYKTIEMKKRFGL